MEKTKLLDVLKMANHQTMVNIGRLKVAFKNMGATPLTNYLCSILGKGQEGCYLAASPSPTSWREQIVAPMQQESSK